MIDTTRLASEIEMLSRADFRAIVNAERRATLAIGALILSWGQFDSSLGFLIQEMRERHQTLGLGGYPEEHPNDQAGQLSLLRRFVRDCIPDETALRTFDCLRPRISAATAIRNDLVHGALSLDNPTRPDEGLSVFCMPCRKAKKTASGVIPARHEMVSHPVNAIFQAADQLREDLRELELLIRDPPARTE